MSESARICRCQNKDNVTSRFCQLTVFLSCPPVSSHRSPPMPASILVAGVYTNLVAFSGDPVTVISSAFVDRVASRRRNNLLALTINGDPLGSFTDVLECSVRRNTEADISLGLDWMASVREWLISLGRPHNPDVVRGLVSANRPPASPEPSSSSAPTSAADVQSIDIPFHPSSPRYPFKRADAVPTGPAASVRVVPTGSATPAHTWAAITVNPLSSIASSSLSSHPVSGPLLSPPEPGGKLPASTSPPGYFPPH
ncbi:hypothetical protein B0H10DRAFT_2134479 [Mycena sp. CBHHK59/15]|nr:hypothetical protein B0H10DRAFT_2134479 [Mycena sp. CBHHK59/15]